VYLIDATNLSTIHSSFRSLGYHEAKLSNDLNDQDMIDEVHAWLEARDDPLLLIFDNADDRTIDLGRFLPQCDSGRIIITTRNEAHCVHAHPFAFHSRIGELLPDEAVALLHQLVPPDKRNHPDAQLISEQIVRELGYLALAIAHAGSYIASSSVHIFGTYLEIFRSKRSDLLSEKPEQTRDKYEVAVYATWELSFGNLTVDPSDKISTVASEFFQLCGFLHPKDISPRIFKLAFERGSNSSKASQFLRKLSDSTGNWDDHMFHRVLNRLASYSFITVVTEFQIQIHPLVHNWSKDRLKVHLRTSYQAIILQILADSISLDDSTDEIDNRRLLVPHLSHIGISSMPIGDTANQYEVFGTVFRESGHWLLNEKLWVNITKQRILTLGQDHPDTLRSMGNLAMTYRAQGRLVEAEELQMRVTERTIIYLGEDHPGALASMHNLASTYWNRGRMSEAAELQVKVMEGMIAKLGEDHPDTLKSMGNLALTYRGQGRLAEAEGLEVKVMEGRITKLGEDHPDTLRSMGNLASTYWIQGRSAEAEELDVKVMERMIAKVGEDHPDTLRSMSNLAVTYGKQGRLAEAEMLQVKVTDQSIAKLGEDHPATLMSMNNLASTYRDQGRLAEADALKLRVEARSGHRG
jgi:tetratricopeptide (TPR) repeat protein